MLLGIIQTLYVLTLFSSFLLDGVALTYTIKALEPICNLCLLELIGKPADVTPLSFIGLAFLPFGIFLSQYSSRSFTNIGLSFAIANVCVTTLRSVLLKVYTCNPDKLYFHVSAYGALALVPVTLFFRQDFSPRFWLMSSNLLIGVVSFIAYNLASFFVLSKVDPVFHASLNVLKRGITISVTILILPRELLPWQLVGIGITFVALGVYVYGRSQSSRVSKRVMSALFGIMIILCLAVYSIKAAPTFAVYSIKPAPTFEEVPILQATRSSNKTLVIVTGSARCGEKAWNSLYTQVLDINQADLALAFGENSDRSASLYSRAKYVWEFPEYEDWGTALDQIGTGWRNSSAVVNLFGGANGTRGSGAIILYLRWFVKGHLKREPGLLDQYDWFIYTRSDHYYGCPHDLHLFQQDPNSLYVPKGEGYGGISDRHLVAPRALILPALSIVDDVADTMYSSGKLKFNSVETLIMHRWKNMGLSVVFFDRMMFTCAVSGDKTRWKIPGPLKVLGVSLKYPKEFAMTKAHCRATGQANITGPIQEKKKKKTPARKQIPTSPQVKQLASQPAPVLGCTSRPAHVCGGQIDCLSPNSTCSCKSNGPDVYRFVPYGYNFGDVSGPTVNHFALGGIAPCKSAKNNGKLLITLGSVLHHHQRTKQEVHLWGTGHIGAKYNNYNSWTNWGESHTPMMVHAVRGQLTLDFLYAKGIADNNTIKTAVVLGDPALLLPYVYPKCRRRVEPSRSICLILHNNDRDFMKSANISDRTQFPDEFDEANVRHSTFDFHKMLELILDCKLVVSSSLHGIIFAEAFGVPARWIQLPASAKSEGDFKYCDYYTGSRSGVPGLNVSDLMHTSKTGYCIGVGDESNPFRPAKTIAQAFSLGGAPPIRGYDTAKLLEAFPLEVMSTCSPQVKPGTKMMIGADLL
jgi:hypothetical protein